MKRQTRCKGALIFHKGQMLISNYRDKNGRYMEYTAEWIPQITNPDLITNFDLSEIVSIQSA